MIRSVLRLLSTTVHLETNSTWWIPPETGQIYSREEIAKILPHRGDMALLDRAWREGEEGMVSEVVLSESAFWVPGHFPVPEVQPNPRFEIGPLFPGVLMVESAAQTGICLWRLLVGLETTDQKLMVFKEITKAVFKKEARPGQRLYIRTLLAKHSPRLMRCECQGVVVNEDQSAEEVFSCQLAGLAV